jgi:hypothetical protein
MERRVIGIVKKWFECGKRYWTEGQGDGQQEKDNAMALRALRKHRGHREEREAQAGGCAAGG